MKRWQDTGATPPPAVALLLRANLADGVTDALGAACSRPAIPKDERTEKILHHCVGQYYRPNVGPSAEALILGVARTTFPRDVVDTAAAAYFASQGFADAFLSHILQGCRTGKMRPVALIEFEMYDESPMIVRAGKADDKCSGSRCV